MGNSESSLPVSEQDVALERIKDALHKCGLDQAAPSSASTPPFQIRIILCQETRTKGNFLLFDSTKDEHGANLDGTSKKTQTNRSTAAQSSAADRSGQPVPGGNAAGADIYAEMMFGAIPLQIRRENTKLHQLPSLKQLFVTKVNSVGIPTQWVEEAMVRANIDPRASLGSMAHLDSAAESSRSSTPVPFMNHDRPTTPTLFNSSFDNLGPGHGGLYHHKSSPALHVNPHLQPSGHFMRSPSMPLSGEDGYPSPISNISESPAWVTPHSASGDTRTPAHGGAVADSKFAAAAAAAGGTTLAPHKDAHSVLSKVNKFHFLGESIAPPPPPRNSVPRLLCRSLFGVGLILTFPSLPDFTPTLSPTPGSNPQPSSSSSLLTTTSPTLEMFYSHFALVERRMQALLGVCWDTIEELLKKALEKTLGTGKGILFSSPFNVHLSPLCLQPETSIHSAVRTFSSWLSTFLTTPRIPRVFWVEEQRFPEQKAKVFDDVLSILSPLHSFLDQPESNFLASSLVTALLTHHTSWHSLLLNHSAGGTFSSHHHHRPTIHDFSSDRQKEINNSNSHTHSKFSSSDPLIKAISSVFGEKDWIHDPARLKSLCFSTVPNDLLFGEQGVGEIDPDSLQGLRVLFGELLENNDDGDNDLSQQQQMLKKEQQKRGVHRKLFDEWASPPADHRDSVSSISSSILSFVNQVLPRDDPQLAQSRSSTPAVFNLSSGFEFTPPPPPTFPKSLTDGSKRKKRLPIFRDSNLDEEERGIARSPLSKRSIVSTSAPPKSPMEENQQEITSAGGAGGGGGAEQSPGMSESEFLEFLKLSLESALTDTRTHTRLVITGRNSTAARALAAVGTYFLRTGELVPGAGDDQSIKFGGSSDIKHHSLFECLFGEADRSGGDHSEIPTTTIGESQTELSTAAPPPPPQPTTPAPPFPGLKIEITAASPAAASNTSAVEIGSKLKTMFANAKMVHLDQELHAPPTPTLLPNSAPPLPPPPIPSLSSSLSRLPLVGTNTNSNNNNSAKPATTTRPPTVFQPQNSTATTGFVQTLFGDVPSCVSQTVPPPASATAQKTGSRISTSTTTSDFCGDMILTVLTTPPSDLEEKIKYEMEFALVHKFIGQSAPPSACKTIWADVDTFSCKVYTGTRTLEPPSGSSAASIDDIEEEKPPVATTTPSQHTSFSFSCVEVTPSPFVVRILKQITELRKMGLSPGHTESFLHQELLELFGQSWVLAQFIGFSRYLPLAGPIPRAFLCKTLAIPEHDLPLLLSIATTFRPDISACIEAF